MGHDCTGYFNGIPDYQYTHPNAHRVHETLTFNHFAIEIFNHSPRAQELKFLGMNHRHFRNENLTLRGINNGSIVDYNKIMEALEQGINHGQFQYFRVGNIAFDSSLICDPYKEKYLTVTKSSGHQRNWDRVHLDEKNII